MQILFGKDIPVPFKQAFDSCKEHFVLAAVMSGIINILYLAPTIYMMQVYDRVVPTSGLMTLFFITIAVTFALATLSALDAIRSRVLVRASLRVEKSLSKSIMARMIQRPNSSSQMSQAMREFDAVRQVIGGPPAVIFFDAPWVPIYIIVAFILHPALALLIIVAGALLIGVTLMNDRMTKQASQESHKLTSTAYAGLEHTSARGEVVRALGMRSAMIEKHQDERAKGLVLGADSQMVGGSFTAGGKFLRLLLQSLALGLGAWLAVGNQISVGAIIAASVLLSRALQPIEQFLSTWPHISRGRSAMKTLTKFFENTSDPLEDRTSLPDPVGNVQAEGVALRAGPQGPVLLNNINFRIQAGEFVGIVGSSGAGKSTLARIIANAIEPEIGVMRMDGADYRDWPADLLAQHIGYLPQDSSLLAGTVAENISRFSHWTGALKADIDVKVIEAAKLAGVHDLILRLPKGYDTELSMSGAGLSAGQSQRVALARALYGNPQLLIMDEPDSALDSDGEAALVKALTIMRNRGVTLIVISHRNKILVDAARLIVMNKGAIVMDGPRQEILMKLAPQPVPGQVVNIGGKK